MTDSRIYTPFFSYSPQRKKKRYFVWVDLSAAADTRFVVTAKRVAEDIQVFGGVKPKPRLTVD
jgi:hypothetical protein